ncbi:MAG TPA: HepT-like ribonuclease domain-containing protein [Geminicoccus sp.]|uniref:HepT-like ribonuclease domain-containing protein n=1 Tax=Geminicoccus sp. TaxID=2024832 RepID=UPI002E2F7B27|nr:HepT-like ribonuclease domain-containing protein [Geminicoccus sp.]HEX2525333.1 HepT-like ribonuclease domain-containing protein [Geminicoccus sp.]
MTAPRDITIWLQDIQDATNEALHFLGAVDLEHYLSDRMRCLAVERLLLLIGDAALKAGQQDPAAMETLRDLPKIVALRNRIANGYWLTDHHLVHGLAERVLPDLLTDLQRLLERIDAGRAESRYEAGETQPD